MVSISILTAAGRAADDRSGFLNRLESFRPGSFVLRELDLGMQARKLYEILFALGVAREVQGPGFPIR